MARYTSTYWNRAMQTYVRKVDYFESAPNYFQIQCWLIVYWIIWKNLYWHFNWNSNFFIHINTFENVNVLTQYAIRHSDVKIGHGCGSELYLRKLLYHNGSASFCAFSASKCKRVRLESLYHSLGRPIETSEKLSNAVSCPLGTQ